MNTLNVIGLEKSDLWDEIVTGFQDYDVYYLSGYVRAFQIHGDGTPQLFYYNRDGLRGIYVYMKRETSLHGVYDAISPYGYGGFLLEGDTSEQHLQDLWNAYTQKMQEDNIVDNFVRYHPVLRNSEHMKSISDVIDLGKTIAMDLSSEDIIWTNIHSKNRNMIRKAEKNGIEIKHGKGLELFDEFIKIYNATMDKDNAEDYYYFEPAFYCSVHEDLKNNYEIFWAEYEGRIIAMSILIFANGRLNYHLSGSDMEYRHLAPSNLLLYKAALWGCEHGLSTLHLGGGLGSEEDNLYKFKEGFNKQSNYQFSIGKEIFDQDLYDRLVRIRAEKDKDFDMESHFFPLYRS